MSYYEPCESKPMETEVAWFQNPLRWEHNWEVGDLSFKYCVGDRGISPF